MALQKKKYLVVGSNSFLGAEIIHKLKKNHEVTGVYHKNTDKLIDTIENIPVSSIQDLKDEYEAVFLISAYIPDKNSIVNEQLLTDVNIALPLFVCEKFKKAKIIYASSVSVYPNNSASFNEQSDVAPNSLYGKSKVLGEKGISHHKKYSIIRISSMYGAGMNESTFLPRIVAAALSAGTLNIYGDGSRLQNYIHVLDAAIFFIRAAQHHSNNTYLAVGNRSYSNMEIALLIKKELPLINIELVGEDVSDSFVYDAGYSYSELNIKPQKSIGEGIKELIQWQQKKS